MSGFRVDGFKKLNQRLTRLHRGPSDDEIAAALFAGARLVGREERRLIPVETGRGRDSIVETMEAANLPSNNRTIYIGPARTEAVNPFYLFFVEWGTEDTPAHPFARVAVATKGKAAMGTVASRLRKATMDLAK
jgi:HK97 gp10 family phage protein